MSQGNIQGWESLGESNSTKYKAQFTLNRTQGAGQVKQNVRVITDRSNGNYDVYETASGASDRLIYSYNASNDKSIIANQGIYDQIFTGQNSQQKSNLDKSTKESTFTLAKNNVTDAQSEKDFQNLRNLNGYRSAANKATVDPNAENQVGSLDQTQLNFINDDLKKVQSRLDYNKNEPIVYPIGLKVEYQDCIKFSIVKYSPSGLKGFGEGNGDLRRINVTGGIPFPKGRKKDIIGTIVLPIPGGISDSNRVGWSDYKLNDLDQALGKLIITGVTGGDIGADVKGQATAAAKEGSGVRSAIVGKVAEGVIGAEGLMQRQFGAIINPNLELLFNSPDLRQFSFSFKLSPRSKSEAEIVRKIIRTFKQAMSVKRSTSSFLLQTPHTFAISYIFKNKDHPYLNKFKECALTNCNVNYTPEATYMSFEDGAMVSYQLDLTFQELEPIYDDDYTDLDENRDTQIGY
jgi:hypothetical protein